MEFRLFDIIEPLKGYIDKIWAFESNGPLPNDDMRLIVPNGRMLLVIPFRNGLVGKMNGETYFAKSNQIALVGISNRPSIVDSETPGPTGTIGVEISPLGAYRFFHLKLGDIKNRLTFLTDILGQHAEVIKQRMIDTRSIEGEIRVLQGFLHSLLIRKESDLLFEYCIRRIEGSLGGIKVRDLAEDTGYSSRWLNMKFGERLGISPKKFGSIHRFQHYYQVLMSNNAGFFSRKTFYDHYYDESHFIKDFKRFTGLTPSTLIKSKNDFGRMFYGE